MSLYISKNAKYYDGRTGNSREISLVLTGSSVQLKKGENLLETWSINQLTVIDHPAPPVPGIFGYSKNRDARLYIDNAKEWKSLYDRLPKHTKKRFVLPSNWLSFFFYSIAAVISLIFLFYMFPRLIEKTAYIIPLEMERSIGRQAVNSMVGGDNVCISPKGREALLKAFGKLVDQSSREIDYEIHVVEQDFMPNAFAAPGGYLIVFSEVIERAENSEEVIGVLAHEIAHVDLYHTTKGMMRSIGMQFVLSMMVGGTSVEDIAGFFSQMSYSRDDESAADMHGRKMMIKAGINPKGIRKFFESIKAWEDGFYGDIEEEITGKEKNEAEKGTFDEILNLPVWEYLSTHPDTDKRIKALQDMEDNTKYTPALTSQEWQDLKDICDMTKTLRL